MPVKTCDGLMILFFVACVFVCASSGAAELNRLYAPGGPCERHRQAVSICWVFLGWSELRELRFIAFPCVQAKTWFHIWFHHATSIFNPFDIFWHFFHPSGWSWLSDGRFFIVFHFRFFLNISSWRCRTWVSNSFVALTTYTTKELWPQTKRGDNSETILEGAIRSIRFLGFRMFSGTFTIFILIFILIMFFTDDIATISYSMYSNIGNIVLIQSSFLLFSRTCLCRYMRVVQKTHERFYIIEVHRHRFEMSARKVPFEKCTRWRKVCGRSAKDQIGDSIYSFFFTISSERFAKGARKMRERRIHSSHVLPKMGCI